MQMHRPKAKAMHPPIKAKAMHNLKEIVSVLTFSQNLRVDSSIQLTLSQNLRLSCVSCGPIVVAGRYLTLCVDSNDPFAKLACRFN